MTPFSMGLANTARGLLAPFTRLAHRVLDRFELPILFGPNRGKRWRIGSGVLGCWIGFYEAPEIAVFGALIDTGDTVFDLGAHAGYFTLVASRLAGPSGRVLAAEPLPANVAALRHHVVTNDLTNVTVVDRAIGNADDGVIAFSADSVGKGYTAAVTGVWSNVEDMKVRTITIDRLIAGGMPVPDVVKMDVEEMEAEALEGASGVLEACRTAWLISFHEHNVAARCVEMLRTAGHDVYDLDGPPVPFATSSGVDYPASLSVVLAVPAGRPVPRVGYWKDQ
jgi:FkbM family methyltransferase